MGGIFAIKTNALDEMAIPANDAQAEPTVVDECLMVTPNPLPPDWVVATVSIAELLCKRAAHH